MFLYPYWILALAATLPEPLKFCIMFAFHLSYKVPIMSVSFQTPICSWFSPQVGQYLLDDVVL